MSLRKIHLKIAVCMLASFFISQIFGSAPNLQTNLFYLHNNANKVTQLLSRKATYGVPTSTPAMHQGDPNMSFPTADPNQPVQPTAPFDNPPIMTDPTATITPQNVLTSTPTPFFNNPFNTPTPTTRPPTQSSPTATRAPTATPRPTVPSINCPASSSESYDGISVQGGKVSNAASHGDINLALRGYSPVVSDMQLIVINGPVDPKQPPQLDMLLSNRRKPTIIGTYEVHQWNFSSNTRGPVIADPEVTMIGVQVTPGETVTVPDSAYSIGDGKEVMVIYADSSRVTLKYMREDGVVHGYTMHVEDFCVDPKLVQKYNELNGSGRSSLPGLSAGKRLGVAKSGELKMVIRDTGSFMDPRGKKNWWQRY